MRFQCEVPELMSALNTVSRALAVRSTMPVLEGILLESCAQGLRLMCTDAGFGEKHFHEIRDTLYREVYGHR